MICSTFTSTLLALVSWNYNRFQSPFRIFCTSCFCTPLLQTLEKPRDFSITFFINLDILSNCCLCSLFKEMLLAICLLCRVILDSFIQFLMPLSEVSSDIESLLVLFNHFHRNTAIDELLCVHVQKSLLQLL